MAKAQIALAMFWGLNWAMRTRHWSTEPCRKWLLGVNPRVAKAHRVSLMAWGVKSFSCVMAADMTALSKGTPAMHSSTLYMYNGIDWGA